MILVTGGTGLVGSHLLLDLCRRGEKVRALHRKSSNIDYTKMIFHQYDENADELFKNIEWFEGDILDITSLEDAMKGVDYVYHVAAMIGFNPKEKDLMMRINVEGTANVVNIAIDHKVKKICYVSSIASLGRAEFDGLVDETTEWKESKDNSKYGISKYLAEREVWRGTEEGLPAVIVNPSIILGLSNPYNGSTQLFSEVWHGLKFYTTGVNGFVDVKDLVRAMILLQESDIKNERFVVSAENINYHQVFNMIADYYGKPRPKIKVNRWMSELAWRFYAVAGLFSKRPPVITKETTTTAMTEYRYSSEKLKKALNFEFRNIEDTFKEVCELSMKYYFNKKEE